MIIVVYISPLRPRSKFCDILHSNFEKGENGVVRVSSKNNSKFFMKMQFYFSDFQKIIQKLKSKDVYKNPKI